MRLTRAPAGVGATAATVARRAYAGPFTDLRATGTVTTPSLRARVSHRFRTDSIETTWSLRPRRSGDDHAAGRGSRRSHRADVLLPSWGRGAEFVAIFEDGERRRLGRSATPLARIAALCVRSARSGYAVVPVAAPAAATARLLRPRAQSSAPHPGPTLAIRIAAGSSFRSAALTLRLLPGRGATPACSA
jgi:hypothetical protein